MPTDVSSLPRLRFAACALAAVLVGTAAAAHAAAKDETIGDWLPLPQEIADWRMARFGAAIAYMHISKDARQLDVDAQAFAGMPTPVRTAETLIEVIYEAHVKPGWLLQPFFQYVFRPSGGVPDPMDPGGLARIGDAGVFGLTTTVKY